MASEKAGPSEAWGARRLWSLWDMLNLPIGELMGAVGTLSSFLQFLITKRETFKDRFLISDESLKYRLDATNDLVKAAGVIGLSTTVRLAKPVAHKLGAMLSAAGDGEVVVDLTDLHMLTDALNNLMACLHGEAETRIALTIPPDKVYLFEQSEPLFGPKVTTQFTTVAFDISESGKCLALELPTAAVFHLMRVMETSISAVARCLSIPDPVQPSKKHWGAISRSIATELKRRNESSPPLWAPPTDKTFFDETYLLLEAVRNAWRNPTMHPDRKHSPEEALNIFSAVKGFMQGISSRIDENGEPKIL